MRTGAQGLEEVKGTYLKAAWCAVTGSSIAIGYTRNINLRATTELKATKSEQLISHQGCEGIEMEISFAIDKYPLLCCH